MLGALVGTALVVVLTMMRGSLGRGSAKAKFAHMFSNTRAVNVLAAARMALFAARDVWFVVGLPVFLRTQEGWSFWRSVPSWAGGSSSTGSCRPRRRRCCVGAATASRPGSPRRGSHSSSPRSPPASPLALQSDVDPSLVLVVGLLVFGVIFALNSAVHSFLILHYAEGDRVAMNVGFYYMANAAGRLLGTVLSGLLYQWQGLTACLVASVILLLAAGLLSLLLPREVTAATRTSRAWSRLTPSHADACQGA